MRRVLWAITGIVVAAAGIDWLSVTSHAPFRTALFGVLLIIAGALIFIVTVADA